MVKGNPNRNDLTDLDEISRRRTLVDLGVAHGRTVQLSLNIAAATARLQQLRAELEPFLPAEPEPAPPAAAGYSASGYPASGSISTNSSGADGPAAGAEQARAGGRGGAEALARWRKGVGAQLGKLLGKRRKAGPVLHWHVDEVDGVSPRRDDTGLHVSVPLGGYGSMSLSGWIVPPAQQAAFAQARAILRGPSGEVVRQITTHPREDVAAHWGDPTFLHSGFRFDLPVAELVRGRHEFELVGVRADRGEARCRVGVIELV